MSDIQNAKTQSTATFVTALWLNAAIFAIELIAFTVLRTKFKSIYEPRTFIPPEKKRSNTFSPWIFGWPLELFKADYNDIKQKNGMDAYFFVRFLRMMVKILLPIWILSWIVLLPVTAAGGGAGHSGLDRFTFGNIGTSKQPRYAAHIILTWVFTFWIWYVIRDEMRNFVTMRLQYLVEPEHAATAQANTILVTGIPTKYLNEAALFELFSYLPGGVREVWLNRDLKDLPQLYDRRLKACNKLESAETKLLKIAAKIHNKEMKSREKLDNAEAGKMKEASQSADSIVPPEKRPSHRLPAGFMPFSLPFIGEKVDTINWARQEIEETTLGLEKGRSVLKSEMGRSTAGTDEKATEVRAEEHLSPSDPTPVDRPSADTEKEVNPSSDEGVYPPINSAFILFNTQIATHMAAQSLTHHEPYRMAEKYTEVAPEDVVWSNLGLNPYEMKVRRLISYSATAALIIFWAIPVAFVGLVSNVANLCSTYKWLAWLCKIPNVVIGILQGFLPPVLLAVLMMLLPIVLRKFAQFEGIPRRTGIELSLMTRYFIFQIIHSFLIVTLASGIIAALPLLVKNPSSVASILASNLPQASNFFLTYVVLQGLTGAASGFLQVVPLVIYYAKLFILGSTPRSIYDIKYTLRGVAWGTLFPATTLIAVITITYSVISPIINGLACFTFFLFYELYKYLFLYQFDQPASGDTGGLFFPKAIQHVFIGMYIQQICLAALFFLAQDEHKHQSAIPEGALMVVLIIATFLFNLMIVNSYGPLLQSLPLSLAKKSINAQRFSEDTHSTSSGYRAVTDGQDLVRRKPVPTEEPSAKSAGVPPEHEEPKDFYHPATVEPQRSIWIPKDTLGLYAGEVDDNVAKGVAASSEHAYMNEKGKVDIDGRPPGIASDDE